ncbi:MAG: DUF4388 domain-containing protein [Acidimicrobiia bacterium]|nr:DUF4388 domain-containing protein [Acidimicrobiia bacterium]
MSLTGHLDVFPLEEVLRLLSRSYKTGCLRIDTPDQHGRVYLDSGSLTFATVASDDDFRRQLSASAVVTDESLRAVEIGGRSLTEVLAPGVGAHHLTDLVREEVVESLYRIRKPARGQFVFNVDVNPRYRMDQTFDVELCVAEADRRAADWSDIELVVPNVDLALRINGEAPNGEPVTLAPNTWRLIATFEGAASVRNLSDRLGLPRFLVAKDIAGLVRAGLIEPVQAAPPVVEEAPTMSAPVLGIPDVTEEPASTWTYQPVEEPAPAAPAAVPVHDRSWWEEPVEATPKSVEEPVPVAAAEEETTQLSDSFLDRVFSQLEETPEGQGTESTETDPEQPSLAHGFLKRRRISSIGLDDV